MTMGEDQLGKAVIFPGAEAVYRKGRGGKPIWKGDDWGAATHVPEM